IQRKASWQLALHGKVIRFQILLMRMQVCHGIAECQRSVRDDTVGRDLHIGWRRKACSHRTGHREGIRSGVYRRLIGRIIGSSRTLEQIAGSESRADDSLLIEAV